MGQRFGGSWSDLEIREFWDRIAGAKAGSVVQMYVCRPLLEQSSGLT